MKHPCTPDCKKRSGTCHATCKKYKKFEAWNFKRIEEKNKAIQADLYIFERQEKANIKKAKQRIKALNNRSNGGHK